MNEMNEKDLENVTGGVLDDAILEREAEQFLKSTQRRQCGSCQRENKSKCQAWLKKSYLTARKNGTPPAIKCNSYR